jgi:hypothetical protein
MSGVATEGARAFNSACLHPCAYVSLSHGQVQTAADSYHTYSFVFSDKSSRNRYEIGHAAESLAIVRFNEKGGVSSCNNNNPLQCISMSLINKSKYNVHGLYVA